MPTYWPIHVRTANLTHWLEPALIEADSDQLLVNNLAVAAYRDMMATGDYAQATAANKPLYKSNHRFGRGALEFDGVDDFMQGPDGDLVLANTTGCVILTARLDDHTTLQDIWADPSQRVAIRVESGSVKCRVEIGGVPATASRALSGPTGLWHTIAWRRGSTQLLCTLDDIDNTASVNISGGTDALGAMVLGAGSAAAARPFNGAFGSLSAWNIAMTSTSNDDFRRAFLYQQERWGDRGDPLEIARERASRFLRLRSRPRAFVHMRTDVRVLDVAPGADVGLSHPRGPHSDGTGWPRSERRPTRKLGSRFSPGSLSVENRFADSLDVAATFYDSGGARRAADPKREGVAVASSASQYEFYRIGPTYVRDPGDLRVVEVKPGIMRVERTPIHWAADPERLVGGIVAEHFATNRLARSSLVNGFTGLTQTPGTGGSIALDSAAPLLFDTAVTPQAGKLTSGTTDCWLGWPATASLPANTHLCWSGDYRCDTGDAPSWQAQRSVDSWYWNDNSQAWQSASVWNALTVGGPLDILRGRSKDMDVGGSATTVTFRFGFPGTTSGRVAHVYHMQAEEPGGFPTSRIVTTTVELARALELIARPNPSLRRGWPNTEGTLVCLFTPLWSRQDLVDAGGNSVFLPHLLQVHHSVFGASSGHGWSLHYDPDAGADGQLQFFGSNAGQGSGPPRATFDVVVAAGQTYRIGATWLDGVVRLFVDGDEGASATINGTPTETDDSVIYIGGRNSCDGYLEQIWVKPRAMHPEWIKAWAA